jgi:peptidoglycan-associated lipoprotein
MKITTMHKKTLLLIVVCTMVTSLFAQTKYIDEANKYYNSFNYCEAADKLALAYGKIVKTNEKALMLKAEMAFKTAECYRFTDRFREAHDWYERAILLDYQKLVPEIHLNNAEMLRMMGEFEKAIKSYELYQKIVPSDTRASVGIESCRSAKDFKANKTRHKVENQASINKGGLEMVPVFGDGKETKMYFSSSRKGCVGGVDPISCDSYTDIFVSEIDKNNNWGEPKSIDALGKVNTEDHEGAVCFDGRYKKMFFTRCPSIKKQNLGCDIWVSDLKGKEWTDPIKLNLKNHDSVSVGHPCVTDDGTFLVFASDMSGGQGGKDLWYATYDSKKKEWGGVTNLGPDVNTAGNELFPTFGKDGSLYFASDGHVGLGGLDMFKASKTEGEMKWTSPSNLGYPLNSENNDYALYEIDDRIGYFTSERKDPEGHFQPDIYRYELPPNLYDVRVIVSEFGKKSVKIPDVQVKVKSTDGSSWEGYTKKDGSTQLWDKKPDGSRYVMVGNDYTITLGDKKGYFKDETGEHFSTVGLTYGESFVIEMTLIPDKPYHTPEVRYHFNKWTFVNDNTITSTDSLLYVDTLLRDHPTFVLELSSHTDSRGSNEANQRLAENRARACYNYLVDEKGVDPRRIVPVGKGESSPRTVYKVGEQYLVVKPIDMTGVEEIILTEAYINQFQKTNNVLFEQLHQLNRRTEVRVIDTKFDSKTYPAADPKFKSYVKYP